ncbi:MAG: nucleotidyltransferase domain-containing protein [Candidatus Cloacimonetes bacterium]|nr:nucleotidyltransferase domain-containing protein [Candidatus Cloacimonadota bacterium]
MLNKRKNKDRIIFLTKQYNVSRLILFGSFLNDDNKAKDIDLACDGINDWRLFELASKMEDELNVSIDLIPISPLNRFTEYILRN